MSKRLLIILAGVVFKVCTPTLELWGREMIAEIDETIAVVDVIGLSMIDCTVIFTC